MMKQQMLSDLRKKCEACQKCELYKTRTNLVFSDGNPESARIVFIGEAPGKDEDATGVPFCGGAGMYLDDLFEKTGFNRNKDLFIINTLKCRPVKFNPKTNKPSNRPPKSSEKQACFSFLQEQIDIIKPEMLVLCGNKALQNFLGEGAKVSKYRGKWFEVNGIKATAIYHPSYLKNYAHSQQKIDETISDLKNIKKMLK